MSDDDSTIEPTIAEPVGGATAEPRAVEQSSGEALERALATLNAREEAEAAAESGSTEVARERDAAGRFKARDAAGPPKDSVAMPRPEPEAPQAEERSENQSAVAKPPESLTPEAKAAWETMPPEIRSELRRSISGMESTLGQYQAAFEPLRPHVERFSALNMRLDQALGLYAATEHQLATDPAAAIRALAKRFGFDPEEVAYTLLDQTPDPRATAEIQALKNEIDQLRSYMGQQNVRQTYSSLEREVQEFQASAPRFSELEGEMAFFLKSGRVPADLPARERLKLAYDLAERLNPMQQGQPERPQPLAPQSITGAPSTATQAARRTPSRSTDEAIRRAMAVVGI